MRTLIENYRGWDIFFDTDKEEFFAESDEYDSQQQKRSYASAKKFVDDFIKDNVEFKPFWIQKEYGPKPIKVVGIRKDKRFIYEGEKRLEQLSEYNEKDYFLVKESNKPIFEQINELNKNIDEIHLKIKEAKKNLIKEGLKEIKEKYSI